MSHQEVKEAWRRYWERNLDNEVFFDGMSRSIASELLRNCGDLRGKKILEAGCGRGIISARLAESGADVCLLDISPEALQIARRHFDSKKLSASFTRGDILDRPFDESTFDIVWNAGVMEHFEGDLQTQAIRRIAETIKPGGRFISFNPYAGAFFYSIGKRAAERKGTWPYGPEFPVRSLREQCGAAGLVVEEEYPICFKENLSYLSYVSKHLRSLVKLAFRSLPQGILLKVFGGYLLVTVAVKPVR